MSERKELVAEIMAIVEQEPPEEQLAFLEIVRLVKEHDDGIRWMKEARASNPEGKFSDIFDQMMQRRLAEC